jgi:uncharacterized membrane protein YbaN (DUF454 family)
MDTLSGFSIAPPGLSAGIVRIDAGGLQSDADALGMSDFSPVAVSPPCEPASGLTIEYLDESAFLQIHDDRLFGPGRETFCRALLESAVVPGAFRRGEISLESATCRLEFAPGLLDRAQVAERASQAIRAATPALRMRTSDQKVGGPNWTSLCAFASAEGSRASIWESRLVSPTRHRLRNLARIGRRAAIRSASLLRMWPGVIGAEWLLTASGHELDVEFDPQVLTPGDIVLASEAAIRVARRYGKRSTFTHSGQASPAADDLPTGPFWDALVAGGSLLLAAAGVVLPGIPTVPFFMLSCHSLSRACPQLQPLLHSLPGVGKLLRASAATESKWTDPDFVAKSLVLSGLVAAFFLIIHPPLPLVLACEFGMMFFSIH